MSVRDWVVAHIFRHKCPGGKGIPDFDPEKHVLWLWDPKASMDNSISSFRRDPRFRPEPYAGKSSAPDPINYSGRQNGKTFSLLQQSWDEQERVSLAIHAFADQLDEWARDNQRKRDAEHDSDPMRTLYGWLFTEQRNYATTLRHILTTDREAKLDAQEAEAEKD